jgi:hypothetical protein
MELIVKKSDAVLIRKLSATDTGPFSLTPEAYVPGEINPGLSVPVDYTIEGELLRDVVIGESIAALRHKRNGIVVPGIFETTPVVSIEESPERTLVKTANSVYEVIPLSPENPFATSI